MNHYRNDIVVIKVEAETLEARLCKHQATYTGLPETLLAAETRLMVSMTDRVVL